MDWQSYPYEYDQLNPISKQVNHFLFYEELTFLKKKAKV